VAAVAAPEAGAAAADVTAVVLGARKRPRDEDVLPPQAEAARSEAAPSKAELRRMPWEQLSANLRDKERTGAEVLAKLTQRVVAVRAHKMGSRDAAVAAGVIPALVAAMGAHPGNAAVQEQACSALRSITHGTDA